MVESFAILLADIVEMMTSVRIMSEINVKIFGKAAMKLLPYPVILGQSLQRPKSLRQTFPYSPTKLKCFHNPVP